MILDPKPGGVEFDPLLPGLQLASEEEVRCKARVLDGQLVDHNSAAVIDLDGGGFERRWYSCALDGIVFDERSHTSPSRIAGAERFSNVLLRIVRLWNGRIPSSASRGP